VSLLLVLRVKYEFHTVSHVKCQDDFEWRVGKITEARGSDTFKKLSEFLLRDYENCGINHDS